MKTLTSILAVLLLGFFFAACEAENLNEEVAESAALLELEGPTKLAATQDQTDDPQRSEDDDDMPEPEGKDPSEDDDDMPEPEGKDPSEDDDDMPEPDGKDPSEDDDDMPEPEGKNPSEDDDDMPEPNS